ncbi:ABC transporter permease subunit [Pseudoroseomonas wenyumeiae]|uniref:ABC transporter permease n=1 Tax=Teichococcus wenyumeiae TaxID=2478470 RepID=A0A3A9JZ02_9PROT|nr:ABC transporter permease [Pseudoroseomonas wenyumeiae]RKK06078.1 ABC transporter permease [Pseudoroseomonas wenyumeiae]RMI25567.1 ABC transporter permease subunit [Pseudoroseomonas wenyumeiae]
MRALIAAAGLLLAWEGFVHWTGVPAFLLPSPLRVWNVLTSRWDILLGHAGTTLAEILLGLFFGTVLGAATALLLTAWRGGRRWLLPLLIASQAIPVFAIAPLLVLWLGFGLASKVAMATIIIFFPVATAFYDGLRRTEPGWLDLASTMGASRAAILWRVRVPAALPGFASGLRVAAAVAPIGAVVGEWVGASAGLGYVMLQANGRSQTDMMFAALAILATMAMALWFATDLLLRRMLPWQPDALLDHGETE